MKKVILFLLVFISSFSFSFAFAKTDLGVIKTNLDYYEYKLEETKKGKELKKALDNRISSFSLADLEKFQKILEKYLETYKGEYFDLLGYFEYKIAYILETDYIRIEDREENFAVTYPKSFGDFHYEYHRYKFSKLDVNFVVSSFNSCKPDDDFIHLCYIYYTTTFLSDLTKKSSLVWDIGTKKIGNHIYDFGTEYNGVQDVGFSRTYRTEVGHKIFSFSKSLDFDINKAMKYFDEDDKLGSDEKVGINKEKLKKFNHTLEKIVLPNIKFEVLDMEKSKRKKEKFLKEKDAYFKKL